MEKEKSSDDTKGSFYGGPGCRGRLGRRRDPFWSPKFALWRKVTIPDVLDKLETRSGAMENLDRAARRAIVH